MLAAAGDKHLAAFVYKAPVKLEPLYYRVFKLRDAADRGVLCVPVVDGLMRGVLYIVRRVEVRLACT